MEKNDNIFVSGHRGMVGSAICRMLRSKGYQNIITASREHLDLRDQSKVDQFFRHSEIRYVFHAAAMVGGIGANAAHPARFIADNLMMQTNVIDSAHRNGVEKLLFLGSSCIYPRDALQPITEDQFLTGPLESTNEPYAVAKIAGIKMCQSYSLEYGFNAISLMPTNLYGPGDNYDPELCHVIPGLMRKFHEARNGGEVVVWGTGAPRREFLHVDDLAGACHFLMQRYDSPKIINVGTGADLSIAELAAMMKDITGAMATITYDRSRPDGTPRKLLDVSKLDSMGWTYQIDLKVGLEQTYHWFKGLLQNERRGQNAPITERCLNLRMVQGNSALPEHSWT